MTKSLNVALPPWAVVSDARRAHIERVAGQLESWANTMSVKPAERDRWTRAAYLHDAVRDLPVPELTALVPGSWPAPVLLHGPAAAILAERNGETDPGVLAAVRYHTVGFAGWDQVGRMLYLADYLEPGRRTHSDRHRALIARVPGDPAAAVREVATERIGWTVTSGRPLLAETVDFWNSLIR